MYLPKRHVKRVSKERYDVGSILGGLVARSGLLPQKVERRSLSPPAQYAIDFLSQTEDRFEIGTVQNESYVKTDGNLTTGGVCASASSFKSLDWSRMDDVPTFEQLAPHLASAEMRRKFLFDLRAGDRICALVVRIKIVVMELRLLCMLDRFRRCISVFMPNERFVVCYDRSKKIYQTNDYVIVHVKTIHLDSQELELTICEDEAILQSNQIPSYYRKFTERDDRNTRNDDDSVEELAADYDQNDALQRLRGNATLSELLSLRIGLTHVSALRCFQNRLLVSNAESNCDTEAESIRCAQNRRFALTHVERGAELTRAGRCFEAIQCFNRAINVDERCADAYVGRGAACAGSNNFPAALNDFEKALEFDPEHKNAKRYRIEVLIAFGKDLEKESQFEQAYEKYLRAAEFSGNSNMRAIGALQRLSAHRANVKTAHPRESTSKNVVEYVDLVEDDEEEEKQSKEKNALEQANVAKRRKIEKDESIIANDRRCSFVGGSCPDRSSTETKVHRIRAPKSSCYLNGSKPNLNANIRSPLADQANDYDLMVSSSVYAKVDTSQLDSFKIKDNEQSAVENRRKLREMEAFIERLKKSK